VSEAMLGLLDDDSRGGAECAEDGGECVFDGGTGERKDAYGERVCHSKGLAFGMDTFP